MDLNQLLCDLKESIHLLVAFMEGNSFGEHKANVWNEINSSRLLSLSNVYILETFPTWSIQIKPNKHELAEAGFAMT